MNNIMSSFIISALAGLSTMIGNIFIFFKFKNVSKVILKALSFASGVMLCISITDLIPSSFEGFMSIYKVFPTIILTLMCTLMGIILSILLNKKLPDNNSIHNQKNLYKVGLISMIAIIIHNIPEGIATFMVSNNNWHLGASIALAISLHNIPEGISISIPIYYSTNNKYKAILYTFIAGMSELLGAILAYLLLKPFINNFLMSALFGLIAGIMIYIPVYQLMPTSLSYKNKQTSYIYFTVGWVFMILSHYLMQ